MIKINGVKATILNEETEKLNSTPSMNQILDRMENTYLSRNSTQNNTNILSTSTESQNGDNMLFVLLPMLMQKNNVNSFGLDNPLIKELLKKVNNPTIKKILELMPKLSKVSSASKKEEKKEEKKIDSFVRTDETIKTKTDNE